MVGIKFTLMSILWMDFYSFDGSMISRQMLSMAIFTIFGGLARGVTLTSCYFLVELRAVCARQK